MTAAPKRRLLALSEQLSLPPSDPGTFENIPKIRHVATESTGQYVRPSPRFQVYVLLTDSL